MNNRVISETFTAKPFQRSTLLPLLLLCVCAFAGGRDSLQTASDNAAQDSLTLTLEECRTLALFNNTGARADEEAVAAAAYMKKAALAAMFPKFSANAAYRYNTGEVHFMPNSTDFSFGTVTAYDELGNARFTLNADGDVARLRDALGDLPLIGGNVKNIESRIGQIIADGYQEIYDRLSPNLTHVLIGQVGVTQPLYLGGRLREMYRVAEATERIAEIERDKHTDDIIRRVDEAYWRLMLVERQKQLAEEYLRLLIRLEGDVSIAAEAGLATGSDMLGIRVKKSEAQQKVLQATNGLELSRMALSELCGLPMETIVIPSDDVSAQAGYEQPENSGREDNNLLMLAEMEKIAHSQEKMAAAGLQPNIIASANYIYTNPNLENGFSDNWRGRGFFTVGVTLNLPIAHADDILRLKAARHTARMAELRREEAAGLLSIRDRQRQQHLVEAQQRIMLAETAAENAKENMRYAEELYSAGLVTASELMQQQTAWLAAETELVEATVKLKMAETELAH